MRRRMMMMWGRWGEDGAENRVVVEEQSVAKFDRI
jgi:hypothetical protein